MEYILTCNLLGERKEKNKILLHQQTNKKSYNLLTVYNLLIGFISGDLE